jgi:alpha-glucosidase
MRKRYFLFALVFSFLSLQASAQKARSFDIESQEGSLSLHVETGSRVLWSLKNKGETIIAPSAVSLQLADGQILGNDAVVKKSLIEGIKDFIKAINYTKASIPDEYNQLTITFKNDFGIVFRVYDDAVAYRFFTTKKGVLTIKNEEAGFNFTGDRKAFIPYMWDYRDGKIFNCSFESLYTVQHISQFRKDSLAFLPLLVDVGGGKKAVILEADLEDYPGMFLDVNKERNGFRGVFAPYPLEEKKVGINYIPMKRADYIATTAGTRNFPWRIVAISQEDKELLDNDIVQKLASPSRLSDLSWIVPGQVSWDWWNAMNVSHVDFRSGMNTDTYKYYIDFASANKAKYIILDAGWSVDGDLTKVIPEIDLPGLVEYGRQKSVGVILWATWYEIMNQMDAAFPFFSRLGIKGLKIDFIDRDDQKAVASLYEIARKAAGYHLMVDYHGVYKPTGLQRTYPNVVGNEGVKGMENVKWAREDVPRYDVTIPFIRMMAGPMDYTPGAMRNSNRQNFTPVNDNPMSQGTRCHQLAMYVIYEVPIQMLSDNPTIYIKEQESTDFITSVPTVFDQTVPLDGEVGEYAALARRKGDNWYVGAMTNWTPRDLELNLSFLGDGEYQAVIFRDGVNADKDATDYKKEIVNVSRGSKLKIRLSEGGGWAARIEKK